MTPMTLKSLLASLLLPTVWLVASAAAQFDDEFSPGLLGRYTAGEGQSCTRVDPALSFVWGENPPDARLGRGPFTARWSGYLMSQANGEYRLYAYAQGRVTIELGGETLLDAEAREPGWLEAKPVTLPFDFHDLEVTFHKTQDRARFALYWSGPQFQLEPITQRLFHDVDDDADDAFGRGSLLTRALRCAACHEIPGQLPPSPAPALDRLGGAVSRKWLIAWLGDDRKREDAQADAGVGEMLRRMPHFAMSDSQAEAVAAYLLRDARPLSKLEAKPNTAKKPAKKKKGDEEKPRTEADRIAEGERLALSTGCLACHRVGEFGSSGLFGGGDLGRIAEKRPAAFFAHWLADPGRLNRDHRMPVFELSETERGDLSLYLATLGDRPAEEEFASPDADARLIAQGRELVTAFRCNACHRLESDAPSERAAPLPTDAVKLSDASRWQASCLGPPDRDRHRPGYQLGESDGAAVTQFVAALGAVRNLAAATVDGEYLLAENNCLACHQRGASKGVAPKLTEVAAAHGELAEFVPAMTPPPLVSVGDKLHDAALADAILRKDLHRPWLHVRMPKFNLDNEQLATLVKHFVDTDRIPNHAFETRETVDRPEDRVLSLAGARLVTPDGFGCTSCHRVGSVPPVKAPLNARGPDLSLLERRIRRPWFDRWVRNPARIVPNMEMPSVQLPVRGVLDEHLPNQLEAVWTVLNTPGFEPPEPNPVRVVRGSGIAEREEPASVLTDVLQVGKQTYIKPLLIGLPNRHNVLLDLETARLAGWWMGDTARQRTKGKSWYWEAAGSTLPAGETSPWPTAPDVQLAGDGKIESPQLVGQFPTEFDSLRHTPQGVELKQRLHFNDGVVLQVSQTFTSLVENRDGGAVAAGFRREIVVGGAPHADALSLTVLAAGAAKLSSDAKAASLPGPEGIEVRVVEPVDAHFTLSDSGEVRVVSTAHAKQPLRVALQYTSNLPIDRYPLELPPVEPPLAEELNIVPGYRATRLPLADEFMPTSLAWRPDGTLVITSLKGRVWLASDTNGDGLEDRLSVFSDELAAPFGAHAEDNYIDVVNKYALLRLFDDDGDGRAERMTTLASGWGHTTDYHDWVVGLPRDAQGSYYLGLPCQQDDRTKAAAHLRGTTLRLVPRKPTSDDPHRFAVEPISGGHRFPIGIALDRHGELFVTDNQGNYNPFNELNHVRQGKRYGFINKLERRPDFNPPLTPPAIDIPHPWTRSVNGIAFLNTPAALAKQLGRNVFGPFEGHLIGCEYDTRRLVRMSLEKGGDTFQGAAYPFSYDEPTAGPPLLGPLACGVAPSGDLYVGSIRDSGWGGANNIGELVRLQPDVERLPAGIAEVRAAGNGFVVQFTRPVNRRLAEDAENYKLSSYTRVSTPAYGGPDVDRRTERVRAVSLSGDRLTATLTLGELREGFVYEFQLKPLVDSGEFFPAEAHYTLRRIPH
ncbi:MAG: c-type cytochrome [Pirellulaceae bacterium]